MKRLVALVLCGMLCPVLGVAQEFSGEGLPEDGEMTVEGAGETVEAAPRPEGDIITFKSGRTLGRVQVIRERRNMLEVQVLPNLPPLMIPLDQVESVEYDDIEPIRAQRGHGLDTPARTGDAITSRVSPELNRKLTAPLAPELLGESGDNILSVLAAIETQLNVPIQVDDEVREMDQSALAWESPPEAATLMTLLQDHVTATFPALRVNYQFESIGISKRNSNADQNGAPLPDATATAYTEAPPAQP